MKLEQVIVSENGTKLFNPEDGFIITGNIYVASVNEDGKPSGGLIGVLLDIKEPFQKQNLLSLLDIQQKN